MKRSQWVLLSLITMVCAGMAVAYVSRSNRLPAAATPGAGGSAAVVPQRLDLVRLNAPEFTQAKEGRVVFKLTARFAIYDQKRGTMFLDSPRVTFFGDNGRPVYLRADRGNLNRKGTRIMAAGRVHAVTDDGQHLYTQTLYFNNKTRQISTLDHVRFVGPRLNLEGIGMRCQVDLKKVQILTRIKSRFQLGRGTAVKRVGPPEGGSQ